MMIGSMAGICGRLGSEGVEVGGYAQEKGVHGLFNGGVGHRGMAEQQAVVDEGGEGVHHEGEVCVGTQVSAFDGADQGVVDGFARRREQRFYEPLAQGGISCAVGPERPEELWPHACERVDEHAQRLVEVAEGASCVD